MGYYLNPGRAGFAESVNSQIYVDKTGLIEYTNECIHTQQKYMCVCRPRRFGKSMAISMLSAYYSRGADASKLFEGLEIQRSPSFLKHLNQYDVMKINMLDFFTPAANVTDMLRMLQRELTRELLETFEDISAQEKREENSLVELMTEVYKKTGRTFIILIDEWDCLFRVIPDDTESQKIYLNFLSWWLKDRKYVSLSYMTGILPIKRYGTHSALTMFREFSMLSSDQSAFFFGFTQEEVKKLCEKYRMSFKETKAWYDGYQFAVRRETKGYERLSSYCPLSIVEAMLRHRFAPYWNQTETYEALKVYLQLDMGGLKDAVIRLLAGDRVRINTSTFVNDMTTFSSKDDILTLLVHLGYLTYDTLTETVSIPNWEVSREYVNAVRMIGWAEVTRAIDDSKNTLKALWEEDEKALAQGIDHIHEGIPILEYDSEDSLLCTLQLAFYFAREYYTFIREPFAGRDIADLCLIPRPLHAEKCAAVLELKREDNAEGTVTQIQKKHYPEPLKDYHGDLLLSVLTYDQKSRKHTCVIERMKPGQA